MALHTGYWQQQNSAAISTTDLEKRLLAVKKTADTNKTTLNVYDQAIRVNASDLVLVNKSISTNTTSISTNTTRSILTKTKALDNEGNVATNKSTTHGNYIQTNKTDILEALTKANTNKASIDVINTRFRYEFTFYYVNLAYNTWHSPQVVKSGYPTTIAYFDEPTDRTKVKLMGHSFDNDSNIDTRSRILAEYKVEIFKTDNSTEEAQMYYKDIIGKKISGKNFYINEEKTLKEMFPSSYTKARALQIKMKVHETGSLGNESILTGIVYQ